jgi:hypothetical protein
VLHGRRRARCPRVLSSLFAPQSNGGGLTYLVLLSKLLRVHMTVSFRICHLVGKIMGHIMQFFGGRSSEDRRTEKDRRSGIDKRTEEEKKQIGERRSGADRRSGLDRRSPMEGRVYLIAGAIAVVAAIAFWWIGGHAITL